MAKMKAYPPVATAGYALMYTGCPIARQGCKVVANLGKLKAAYDKVAKLMSIFGITMPFAKGIEKKKYFFKPKGWNKYKGLKQKKKTRR